MCIRDSLNSTKHMVSRGYVGNDVKDCHVGVFCDSDYAGDTSDSKSVTGVMVAIIGSHTYMPIAFRSKKQECVSKSTCEAEVVAMCQGLQFEAIPVLDIWDVIDPTHEQRSARGSGGKPSPTLVVYEDNQAAIAVAENGKSSTMRHVSKTHRVNLSWLSEIVNKSLCAVMYLPTHRQAADILTKGFTKPRLFATLRTLVGVHDPKNPSDFAICSISSQDQFVLDNAGINREIKTIHAELARRIVVVDVDLSVPATSTTVSSDSD